MGDARTSRRSGRYLVPQVAEEAREAEQPTILGQHADIDPGDRDGPVRHRKRPGEAADKQTEAALRATFG